MDSPPLKAFALTLGLRSGPGVVDEYTAYHRAVWPEVLEGLRGVGIDKMKIFLHDRRLFMYLEAGDDFDPAQAFPRLLEEPRGREWDELMRGFQEPVPGAKPGEWWAGMEEVFDLDW